MPRSRGDCKHAAGRCECAAGGGWGGSNVGHRKVETREKEAASRWTICTDGFQTAGGNDTAGRKHNVTG